MRIAAVILLAAVLLGCRDTLTSLDVLERELPLPEAPLNSGSLLRRVSSIDEPLLAVPARTRVGDTLELMVPVASGGCLGSDTTVVTVAQRQATIVPYQTLYLNATCPAIYLVERRTVRVRFMEKGDARLRIVSRNGSDQQLVAIERSIVVE